MTAGEFNFTIEQGSTLALTLYFENHDETPKNLENHTARMKAKKSYADSEAVINLTTENSGITLGGALGTIAINMSATATALLEASANLIYDLEVVSNVGVVERVIEGLIEVSPEVTK